ncbi:unnamed protein product [Caenorhabditis auriculariae]|uniref:Uncharacterized protein n=1 Tax=Caenorhabditis auriculariae TaxID=2777116 RepID=A0A8S1HFZ5_9PELO|nr:unnamed protein product [Caenorhabditis auriculariae]
MISRALVCLLFALPPATAAKRHPKALRHCREPPNLKDELAAWMRESLEGNVVEEAVEDWAPLLREPPICSKSPRAEGEASVMQRALCPWEAKVNYEETREPKMISESTCLCRKSRGSSGAFCVPIIRQVAVLRRVSCDLATGQWRYTRSTQSVTVGCHSVLPRTQRTVSLAHFAAGHPL